MFVPVLLVALTLASQDSDPALRGLDPVALCEGNEIRGEPDLQVTHGRFTYRFADPTRRARFLADPERWGIQWGGGCGRMGPLSGVGSPERWTVHDGRIYIFSSDGCRAGFREAPERFVAPAATLPPLTTEAREAGAAWIERAVDAHGGAAVIDAAPALRLVFEGPKSGWTHRVETIVARDGRLMRRSAWTPPPPDDGGLETRWVLDDRSFIDEGEAVFPMTSPDQLVDLRRYKHREPLALLWARKQEGGFRALYTGQGKLDGKTVENVLVLHEGLATTLHLDPESGLVRGLSWRGRPNDGVTRDVVEAFSEQWEVEGILLPYVRTATVDGEPSSSLSITWNEVGVSSAIPSGSFERGAR